MAADVNDLIKAITTDVKTIVRNEIELAKSELIPSGKNAGIGAGMFGGAGYVGLNAVSLLFMAGGFGIAALFAWLLHWSPLASAAMGFLIMAIILGVIAAILAMIGKGRFSKVKGPVRTQEQAQLAVADAQQGVKRGLEDVNSGRSFENYLVEKSALTQNSAKVPARRADYRVPTTVVGDADIVVPSGATRADAKDAPATTNVPVAPAASDSTVRPADATVRPAETTVRATDTTTTTSVTDTTTTGSDGATRVDGR